VQNQRAAHVAAGAGVSAAEAKKMLGRDIERVPEAAEQWARNFAIPRDIVRRIARGNLSDDEEMAGMMREVQLVQDGMFKTYSEIKEYSDSLAATQPDWRSSEQRALSQILFHVESLLDAAIEAVERERLCVDVKCYDGCLIRRDPGVPVDDAMVQRVEEYVRAKTGYIMRLKVKPFD
jgi:hypothetical protein